MSKKKMPRETTTQILKQEPFMIHHPRPDRNPEHYSARTPTASLEARIEKGRTPAQQAIHDIQFIDSLVDMGEEPYEIESCVCDAARSAAEAFIPELQKRGLKVDPDLVRVMLMHLFTLHYLERWAYKGTFKRIFKPGLRQYFDEMPFEYMTQALAGLSAFDVIAFFFKTLAEWGYPVDAPRLEKAVFACEKEFRHRVIRESRGARNLEEAGYISNSTESKEDGGLH